jgi:hypothetical protein
LALDGRDSGAFRLVEGTAHDLDWTIPHGDRRHAELCKSTADDLDVLPIVEIDCGLTLRKSRAAHEDSLSSHRAVHSNVTLFDLAVNDREPSVRLQLRIAELAALVIVGAIYIVRGCAASESRAFEDKITDVGRQTSEESVRRDDVLELEIAEDRDFS